MLFWVPTRPSNDSSRYCESALAEVVLAEVAIAMAAGPTGSPILMLEYAGVGSEVCGFCRSMRLPQVGFDSEQLHK
jgi:hypothetical protein